MGHRMDIPSGEYLAGLEEATRGLQELIDGMAAGSAQGLADAAVAILQEAVARAPVQTGALRESGYVELNGQPYAKGAGPSPGVTITGSAPAEATHAKIGFSAGHAAGQHEQVAREHPGGGEPKYLERAVEGNRDEIARTIADAVWKGAEKNHA